MLLQHKNVTFSVKAIDDEQGLIEAYGSVFNVNDEGDDIVRPGAFKRTIQNSKARVQAGKAKFLAAMLWQHDANQPIGGWYDLREDSHGLLCKGKIILTTQLGRDVYELIKAGVIDQFSIGYDIMSGGAHYDSKTGYRELTELRLWEISPVTFAMNQEALLIGVKAMEYKSVCGNTSGPIGPREEKWDGAAAKRWIWSQATDSDGNVKSEVARKYFMRIDGDPSEKGSYSYPFWTNGHISVGGVKAVANALSGARNADPDGDSAGMRRKVEHLYSRINSKYPDATPLTPPWKSDDGKSVMTEIQHKDFNDHYRQEAIEDWLYYEFNNLVCALKYSLIDAFLVDDQPEEDIITTILHDGDTNKQGFISALESWVARGVQLDASSYLQETLEAHGITGTSNAGYYAMSRGIEMETKAGRAISAANMSKVQAHIDNMKAMAQKAMDMSAAHHKAMQEHHKSMSAAADDLATVLQGSEAAYGTDSGTPEDGQQEGKSATPYASTRGSSAHSSSDTAPNEEEIAAALAQLRALRS
jgi:HK97 family phage prohead protease